MTQISCSHSWNFNVKVSSYFLSRTQLIKRLKKNAKELIYRILLSLEMTLFADIRCNMRKCESVLSFYYYLYLFILIMWKRKKYNIYRNSIKIGQFTTLSCIKQKIVCNHNAYTTYKLWREKWLKEGDQALSSSPRP